MNSTVKKRWGIMMALVMFLTLLPTITYNNAAFADDSTSDQGPQISKYVEKRDGDQYDLSLTVKGTPVSSKKADFLFIIDTTGSMEDTLSGSQTRWQGIVESVKFLENLVSTDGIDARYSAITFAEDLGKGADWSADSTELNNLLDYYSAYLGGGTNYEAPFKELVSNKLINNMRSNAEKIVIFITDGEPNMCYDENGNPKDVSPVYDDTSKTWIYPEAINAATAQLKNLSGVDEFYSIGVGQDVYQSSTFDKLDASISDSIGKGYARCSSQDEIETALSSLIQNAFQRYSPVTVTDSLSENAELVSGTQMRITVTDTNGSQVAGGSGSIGDGASVSLSATNVNPASTLELTYDSAGKKLQLSFPDGYYLEDGWEYKITVTIEPTQTAYSKYSSGGYTDTGDDGTGTTSAGKEGFYCNTRADLSYKDYDGTSTDKEYPMPVIQVDLTSVKVTKVWDDDNNQDGIRPASVTVTLLADGIEKATAELNDSNHWSYTFQNLPNHASGAVISYTIKELSVEGYTTTVTGDAENGYIITNTHTPETTAVSAEKQWLDDNNADGKRPTVIHVNLLADGKVIQTKDLSADENGSWHVTFGDLPMNNNGVKISYSISEDPVDGYKTEITGSAEDGFVITNTRSEKTSIPVKKNWIGPSADSVKVHLLANGTEVSTAVLNEESSWSYEFTDLEKYNDEGQLITYTLTEDLLDNYSTVIDGDQNTGFTITNTNTELTSVHVEKQWKGDPADSVTVNLLADGTQINSAVLNADNSWKQTFADLSKYDSTDGHEINYTIEEVSIDGYTSVITGSAADGFIITNTRSEKTSIPVKKNWIGPSKDSVKVHLLANGTEVSSAILNEENNWSYEFTDLEKYDEEGQLITYTLTENPLDNYSTVIDGDQNTGFTVTNTNTIKTEISVEKKWKGTPTDSVTIKLLADGEEKDSAVLNEENSWKYTFTDLLKYDSTDGHEIRYTVEEVSLDGYTTVISGDPESGYIITNTIVGKISMPVTKVWKGETGDKAVIHLFANEKEVDSVTLNKGNNWTYIFADLDEYDAEGVKIRYSIKEDPVKGYETSITGNAETGFTVTNTQTKVPGTGVNTHNSAYWSLMIAAIGLLIAIGKKKPRQQEKL